MNSLHNRHLLSSSIIFLIGVMSLGAWLNFNIHQRKVESVSSELESTAYNLLGYIEYKSDSFLISDINKPESDAFIYEQKLRKNSKVRFAYIWDISQQKIIWNPFDNHNINQESAENSYVLFDFEAILSDVSLHQELSTPQTKTRDSVPLESGVKPEQYLVAAQKFTLLVDDNQRNYLYIVATSAADIEREADDLLMVFATLFLVSVVLLFIAHFAFGLWVVAPIRELEQEILALRKGTQQSIEQEYPKELKLIKHTINTLIDHEKNHK